MWAGREDSEGGSLGKVYFSDIAKWCHSLPLLITHLHIIAPVLLIYLTFIFKGAEMVEQKVRVMGTFPGHPFVLSASCVGA